VTDRQVDRWRAGRVLVGLMLKEQEMEDLQDSSLPRLARRRSVGSNWKAKKSMTQEFYTESSEAQVKASHLQDLLEYVDRQSPPIPMQVREHLSADSLTTIESSMRTEWLPITVDKELTEVLWDVLSREQFENFWTRYGLATLNSPLLTRLIGAAVRLFGTTISDLSTWVPQVYNAYYRNCGRLTVGDRSENHCNLVFNEMPPEMIRSRPNVESCAYCFAAIYPLTGKNGKITIKNYDVARRSVTFFLEWI
jgi:hypothetical protein